jgi:hypothetical protein
MAWKDCNAHLLQRSNLNCSPPEEGGAGLVMFRANSIKQSRLKVDIKHLIAKRLVGDRWRDR